MYLESRIKVTPLNNNLIDRKLNSNYPKLSD